MNQGIKHQNQFRAPSRRKSLARRAIEKSREVGLHGTLRHTHIVVMHRAHTLVEKITGWWRSERDGTLDNVQPNEADVDRTSKESGCPHVASPWLVLDWVNDALPADKSDWTFVDLGAGKGRAMLAAGQHPYKKVTGVEFAAELAETARANTQTADQLKAMSLEVLHCDAAHYKFPQDPVIVFLFNPFDPPVINKVAEQISQSYARTPRPMIIAYLNPKHTNVFAELSGFTKQVLDMSTALKFAALSPYKLHLFATSEAVPNLPSIRTKH